MKNMTHHCIANIETSAINSLFSNYSNMTKCGNNIHVQN